MLSTPLRLAMFFGAALAAALIIYKLMMNHPHGLTIWIAVLGLAIMIGSAFARREK